MLGRPEPVERDSDFFVWNWPILLKKSTRNGRAELSNECLMLGGKADIKN
jgi:hypothetical protein